VAHGADVTILRGVTWISVKNLNGTWTEVPSWYFD
jgi:hypothetical protein